MTLVEAVRLIQNMRTRFTEKNYWRHDQ